MVTQIPDPQEVAALRGLVEGFINKRLQVKLDEIKDDSVAAQEKKSKLYQKFERENWLANAASRVSWIQVASHILKGIHPSARGTSLYVNTFVNSDAFLLGTHTLKSHRHDDATGNAAALDVFDFLKIEHQGRNLLARLTEQDIATLKALSEDTDQSAQWAQAFASVVKGKGENASHTLAKQLYFPLAEGGYHLLAPLFPTSLVHGVHLRLQEDRFSEAAKAARTAKRNQQAHPHGFCDYPDMALRKMGGSNPQGVSQLNSERGGANHLLASVPPVWKDQGTQPPLRVTSVFDKRGVIGRDRTVYFIAKVLRPFLVSVVDVDNNKPIRDKRAELVQAIIDRVLDIATALQCLPTGWSGQPACTLSWAQKQWLDVDAFEAAQEAHAQSQDDTLAAPQATEWRERVAEDFARWLNATIATPKTPMGDVEYVEWKHTFLEAL
jgi:CRISPR-associated protein Csy1